MSADSYPPSRSDSGGYGAVLAIFNALLYLCPRDFRRTYRAEMHEHFAAVLSDEGLRYALFGYLSVLWAALRERGTMMLQDISFAVRTARKSPLFSAIVILTMAIAIGANVAVYSVLKGVVLKPLPYAHPDRLAFAWLTAPWAEGTQGQFSTPEARSVREQQRSFVATSVFINQAATLLGYGPPRLLQGQQVSHEFFDVFETRPELGRFFISSDEADGSAHRVIISDKLWRTVFASDPHVIGQTIRLSDTPSKIVGIAPATFVQPDAQKTFVDADYWSVFKAADLSDRGQYGRGNHSFTEIVSLKPSATIGSANADLARIFKALEKKYPGSNALTSAHLVPLREDLFGNIQATLLTIFAVVAGVLLIGCVNVANLLLSRAAGRERELSVRFAVGASRARIISQLFTETLLYVGTGALLGLGLAAAGIRAFVALRPPGIPRVESIAVDPNVILYTVGLVAVATVLAGLVPALSLSRPDLSIALKAGGRGGHSSRGAKLRGILVTAEIALALVLVTTSGLSLRSYLALTNRPIGIDASNVYVGRLSGFSEKRYAADDATRNFQRDVLARLAATPGIEHVAFAFNLPFGPSYSMSDVRVQGDHLVPGHDKETEVSAISPDTFAVLRIPLLRGRTFSDGDTKGAAPVAIVSEEFVKRYLPGSDGIGKVVKVEMGTGPGEPPYRRVVGVVGDTRHTYALENKPEAYLPNTQLPIDYAALIVRSTDSQQVITETLKRAVAQVDPTLSAPRVETLRSRMGDTVGRERIGAILLGSLAFVALLLAIAGVYGVVSYDVGQRTHEIGVRVALGATTRTIVVMVLRGAIVLASSGIAIGLGLAALSSWLIEGQLVDVSALDPRTYLVVIVLLAVAVFFASLIPALRAARVDPVTALRYE